MQTISDAYDEHRIDDDSSRKMSDLHFLEYMAMIVRGMVPHEKASAQLFFTRIVKKFEKCTKDEQRAALQMVNTKTKAEFTEAIREIIANQTGYTPSDDFWKTSLKMCRHQV
jgi:hypothetical protein